MATNIKKKKVSELPEATDTTGFWIFGSKTVGGAVTSVKFAFDKIISLFGVTQEKGQSVTLAPSQKLFSDVTNELDYLIDAHTSNSKIHLSETEEPGFAVCDINGNCAFYIGTDGISNINLDIDFASEFIKSIFENGFAVSDANGNASLFIDKKGEADLKLSKVALRRLKAQLDNLDKLLQSDYNHIISYGQSLGEGDWSVPAITTAEFSPMAKMFNHGIRTRFAVDPKYVSFVPHTERNDEDSKYGETPAAGTAEMLISALNMEEADGKNILSSCCARGAMAIEQLSKGTEWYNNILNDVKNGKRLATESGKTYRLIAVTWTQGEYDYGNGIDYYKQKLIQLRADLIADIETITGDDYSALPFVMYQVSSSYSYGKSYPDIALAQLQLATESDTNGFYMATPIYHLKYVTQDPHLTNFSSKWMGAYYGYVLYNILNSVKWKPLYPVSHSISDNIIYLRFSKSGLVFDKPAYITASITNRGFSVKNASNTELIQSVEIYSGDSIKITCSTSPTGLSVTYGFANSNNRNAGELRDNQEIIFPIQGDNYHLYNWCTIFEYKL